MTVNPYDRIHKAAPSELDSDRCAVCGHLIKSVPGGQGPTFVHTDTGSVAGPNPPAVREAVDEIRRQMVAAGVPQADLAAAQADRTCDWCGESLYEFEGKLVARREAGLICRSGPGGGEYPEHHAGGWAPDELQAVFLVVGFSAPFVVAVRKSDDQKGTLEFTHSPRRYFGWKADTP